MNIPPDCYFWYIEFVISSTEIAMDLKMLTAHLINIIRIIT